jgi:hypothetical protein
MRTSRDMTFNKAEIATSMNVRSLPQKATTPTTSTETTETTTNANTDLDDAEKAPFESITVDPRPVRRSTRHRKATFKAIGANAVGANAVGAAGTPTTPADEEESEQEDYLPKAMIAKSIITNENKPTYEEAMASSEEFQ